MSLAGKSAQTTRRRPKGRTVMRAIAPQLGRDGTAATKETAPFAMSLVTPPQFPARVFDIRSYGAVAGRDATAAIEAAIMACSEVGGGRVLVPAGKWPSGQIHLRSNVDLHLADGAELQFSADPADYLPGVFVRWCGQECYNYSPLIYAHRCRNIAITGRGVIMPRGGSWWDWKKQEPRSSDKLYRMVLKDVPVARRRFACDDSPLRPQLIAPIECENVLLEDFTVGEGGPFWSIHLAYCRNAMLRRLNVRSPEGPNTNAIVIDSSSDVVIEDCQLHSNDDCICLKSGMNEDGWRVDRPTENVIVRRVVCTAGHGGITIGSEMSGGVRNVYVHDCRYDGLVHGIRMKAARGRGGIVEDVWIDRIEMGQIENDAIQITTEYSTFTSPDGRPPMFRNIKISNVTCRRAGTAARLIGQSDLALQGVTLEHLNIQADEGLCCTSGSGINLFDVRIIPTRGPVISLRDGQDVVISGLHQTDSASVFLDLRGRRTRNIQIRGEPADHTRPAVVLGVDVPRDAVVHD